MIAPNYIFASCKPWHKPGFDSLQTERTGHWEWVATPQDLLKSVDRLVPRYIFFLHWNWRVPSDIWSRFECVSPDLRWITKVFSEKHFVGGKSWCSGGLARTCQLVPACPKKCTFLIAPPSVSDHSKPATKDHLEPAKTSFIQNRRFLLQTPSDWA